MVAKKPAKSRRGLHLRLQAGDDLRRRPVQLQKEDYLILSEITVETVPFVGELIYEDDRPDLTEGMKRRLIVIRQVILKNAVGK